MDQMFTLEIGNSWGMWLACIPLLAVIMLQSVLIYRKANRAKDLVGLTPAEGKRAFRTGLITAIGPAFSSFISIIAMSAVMGGPITWQRTSIIASAATELRASQYTAEAAGVVLGGEGFTVQMFCACLFVMAVNGIGWLIFCFLFTDKMSIVTNKISGGSTQLMNAFATAAVLGTYCYMASKYIQGTTTGGLKKLPDLVALVGGSLTYYLLTILAKKCPKLKQWNFGLSLLGGMFLAAAVALVVV